MRWAISVSVLLILIGAGLTLYAATLPIYTDPTAPERLSEALDRQPGPDGKVPDTHAQFIAWYSQIHAYENPHKKLSDLGRGLCASGFGFLLASGYWSLYHRFSWIRTVLGIALLWLALWAVRIPLTIWYYAIRQERFDYPTWGDSVAIPIFSESFSWMIGAAISSFILVLFLIRHPLPATITFVKPKSAYSWIRATLIVCWIAFLGICLTDGIPDGDEGMVLTSILASVILLVFLSAHETSNKSESAPSTPSV